MNTTQSPPADSGGKRGLAQAASLVAGICAALSLFSIMMLMLVDVAARYAYNSPVPGAAEIIELLMGITVFAAMPLVTASNEHIKLDYLTQALKGRVQAFTNALVTSISAGGMGLIAWRIADKAITVARYGDTTPFLRIPIGPIAYFIAFCAAVCTLIFFVQALTFWYQTVVGTPANAHKGQPS